MALTPSSFFLASTLSVLFRSTGPDRKWTKFQTMVHFRRSAPAAEILRGEGGGCVRTASWVGCGRLGGWKRWRTPRDMFVSSSPQYVVITCSWHFRANTRGNGLYAHLQFYSAIVSAPLLPTSVSTSIFIFPTIVYLFIRRTFHPLQLWSALISFSLRFGTVASWFLVAVACPKSHKRFAQLKHCNNRVT